MLAITKQRAQLIIVGLFTISRRLEKYDQNSIAKRLQIKAIAAVASREVANQPPKAAKTTCELSDSEVVCANSLNREWVFTPSV